MERYEEIVFEGKIYKRDRFSKRSTRNYFYRNGRKDCLHRDIWKSVYGEIPKRFHVHHKDGNPLNNSIENLECCSPKEHCRAHSISAKLDPSKDIYESRRKWQRSEEGKKHHSMLGKLNCAKRQKKSRICANCGQEESFYLTSKPSKTCKKCRGKAGRIKPIKLKIGKFIPLSIKCRICNVDIIQKTRKPKNLCSNKCKSKARLLSNIDNIKRKCYVCSKEFMINKYSRTQTCGDSCRSVLISLSMRSRS